MINGSTTIEKELVTQEFITIEIPEDEISEGEGKKLIVSPDQTLAVAQTQETFEIQEDQISEGVGKELIVSPDQTLAVAQTQETLGYDCLISHGNVVKTATVVATTFGAPFGGLVGRAIAPEIAENVSQAVRETVKKSGDDITQQILVATGLGNIPGAGIVFKAEVTDLAHKAGEQAYKQTVDAVTTKGAVVGSVVSGVGTVVALEAANGVAYLYKRYVQPSVTNYFEQRNNYRLNEKSQKNTNKQIATGAYVSKYVSENISDSEDDELNEFVNVKVKK